MDYPKLIERAMYGVVREALRRTAEHGLPGIHHFYITFRTRDPGVGISDALLARFPDEMTIVLENKFWGLEVSEEAFAVTLSFGGRNERLTVPFAALTAFVDPSVKFGLQFGAAETAAKARAEEKLEKPEEPEGEAPKAASDDAEVIPLDVFRKK